MKIRDRNIFITGGCGFIGSAIIQRLAPYNKIIIFDNKRRNALQYFAVIKSRNSQIIKGDILNTKLLKNSLKGCDTIIHLAAMAGVSSYYNFPVRTMEVNLLGTYNLLNTVKDMQLRIFLDFSTSEVYGPYAYGVKESHLTTQGPPEDLRWTYAVSKLAAEHFTFAFAKEYKLPIVSVRPFNIYGPGQVGESAVQIFIRNALCHKPLVITGNGSQIRTWCYIDDLVDAVELMLMSKDAIGNIFNIGNPKTAINILDLAKKIIKITCSDSKITFCKHIGTDCRCRIPNIEKAKQILNFKPKVGLDKGLQLSVNWYREHLNHFKDYE